MLLSFAPYSPRLTDSGRPEGDNRLIEFVVARAGAQDSLCSNSRAGGPVASIVITADFLFFGRQVDAVFETEKDVSGSS